MNALVALQRGSPLVLPLLLLAGCSGDQSVLAPTGHDAQNIAVLWWVLFAGSCAILAAICLLTLLALAWPHRVRGWLGVEASVWGGGIVFPVVVLSILLGYGLMLMRASAEPADDPLRVAVIGERWWWRVVYTGPDGRQFEDANQLRIPVGRPVEISLTTADVIHSFWVPKLAGKLDMIPGRTTRLTLTAREAGLSRGQCAEYCGGAHALMAFHVEAMPAAQFDRWLGQAAGAAPAPESDTLRRGRDLFVDSGCGACHSIRGTAAAGKIGPDLTQLGSRRSLGAGTLANTQANISRWIKNSQHIKPENLMPEFRIFGEADLEDLSAYLSSLK